MAEDKSARSNFALVAFALFGLFAAAMPLPGPGRQLFQDLTGGPWRLDPALKLEQWSSPPCTRYNLVLTWCRFAYTDGQTSGDMHYLLLGGFAGKDDSALLVRSQQRPDVVTMAHALGLNTRRTISFLVWEALALAMILSGVAGLVRNAGGRRNRSTHAAAVDAIDAAAAASRFNESPEQLAQRLTGRTARPGGRPSFGLRRS
jgi:hypothetical protein